jgi:hypothetical protein
MASIEGKNTEVYTYMVALKEVLNRYIALQILKFIVDFSNTSDSLTPFAYISV